MYQRVIQKCTHSAIEYISTNEAKKKFNKKAKSIQSCRCYLICGVVVFFFLSSFLSLLSPHHSFAFCDCCFFARVAHLAAVTFFCYFSFDLLHFAYTRNWCIVAGSLNSKHWSLLMQLNWTMSYATNANAFSIRIQRHWSYAAIDRIVCKIKWTRTQQVVHIHTCKWHLFLLFRLHFHTCVNIFRLFFTVISSFCCNFLNATLQLS